MVEGWASNLWIACSNYAPVLLFISLLEFYKCIFRANVIDFEIFKTVVIIFRILYSQASRDHKRQGEKEREIAITIQPIDRKNI